MNAAVGKISLTVDLIQNVLLINPEGGNVRSFNIRVVEWSNRTPHTLQLQFKNWLPDGEGRGSSSWPFANPVKAPDDDVLIHPGGKFSGTLSPPSNNGEKIIVKYGVAVVNANGTANTSTGIAKLDPIIIVER